MVFQPRTAVVAMLTGTLVTLVASVWPAVRATRVAPIAAVREGGMVVKRQSRRTLVFGLVVTAARRSRPRLRHARRRTSRPACACSGSASARSASSSASPRSRRGSSARSPHVVGLPAARLGGAAGRLAQENAVRNPGRTASTAAALMIGLTLVSFVAVFGKGAARERRELAPQAARHEPRDHLAERLGHRAARRRRGRGRGARRRRSARRSAATGPQLVGRRRGRRQRRRPGDDRQGVQLRVGRGLSARRWRRSRDGDAIVREGEGHVGRHAQVPDACRQGRHGGRARRLPQAQRPRPAARPGRALAGGVRRSFPRPADLLTLVEADSTAALEQALAAYPGREAPDRRRVHRRLDGLAVAT